MSEASDAGRAGGTPAPSQQRVRVQALMRARVDEQGVWTFTGGGDVAPVAQPAAAEASGAVRSTRTISPDRAGMTARWERSDDGASWQPWMDMTFTRVAGRHPPQPTPTRDRLPAAHGGVDA